MVDTHCIISASTTDSNRVIRRRQRLGIDYQLKTRVWLAAHSEQGHGTGRTVSRHLATLQRQFLSHYFSSPPRWRVWIRQLLKDRALPDFCIIGPGKSGTSDLAITIMAHPNVLYPLVKELRPSDPLAWRPFYPTVRAVQRHAERHGVALCPFVAPSLHRLDVATALADLRPNTKIVINLRNPVDLVFSEWKWYLLHSEKDLVERVSFLARFPTFVEKALELFPATPTPFGSVLHNGIYAPSVAHWLRSFGEHNVRIFDIADYFRDRGMYLARLEQFLGLPNVPLPQRMPVANKNPLDGLAATPETSSQLKAFFEPYNRCLWEVLGTVYSW